MRSVSIVSPMNSSRTGCGSPAGKTSTMPPRTANSPCSSAGSSRVKPASTSRSARSVGEMSCPGFSVERRRQHPLGRRHARQHGGRRRDHDARGALRDRVQRARAHRRDADVRRQAAIGIDFVRRKRQHRALDRRGRAALRAPPGRTRRPRTVCLEVAVARHDVEHDAVRLRVRRGGDEQRLRGRREAGDRARRGIHPAAGDGGLQDGAKVQ